MYPKKIEANNQRTILKNMPSISSKSKGSLAVKFFKKFNFSKLKLSVIFHKLSFNLIPLYKPIDINRKNEMDRMEVEKNEFSITV